MATTREDLETKAKQRINPLLTGLSMLTGGLAGELTGTNEQIRQQRRARAALLEEQQRDLQEERISERMRLQRQLMLEEDLKRAEAARQAATLGETRRLQGETMVARGEDATMMGPLDPETALGVTRAKAAIAKAEYDRIRQLEGRRNEMTGYLSAQGVQTGEPDIETLAFLESQQKAREDIKKQKKDVMMQLTTKSGSTVYGTYDELASRFPDEVKNISVAKEKVPGMSTRMTTDEFGTRSIVHEFGGDITPEQAKEYVEKYQNVFGTKKQGEPEGGQKSFGKAPPAAPGAPQVSRFGGTRAAATTPAAAAPIMGTPTAEEGPSIWNTNVPGFERGYGLVPDMPPGGFKPTLKDVTPTMPTTEGIREFLGPFVQMASRSTGELAPPIPTRRSSEMFADPEAYKQYLRKQMGGY